MAIRGPWEYGVTSGMDSLLNSPKSRHFTTAQMSNKAFTVVYNTRSEKKIVPIICLFLTRKFDYRNSENNWGHFDHLFRF